MKVTTKHFNALTAFTGDEITTKQKQSIIRYVCGVPNIDAGSFNLFTIHHVGQREEMNPCIDRCRMDFNFANFFSVESCAFSSSFALHNIRVEPSTKNCTNDLQIMAVLVVSLHRQYNWLFNFGCQWKMEETPMP